MAETMQSLDQLGTLKPAAPEAPKYVQKLDKQGRAYATGKRKNAVARVWIKPGAGKIIVNTRPVEVYFARPVLRMLIQQPLVAANRSGQYDVVCTVSGGGLSGQAGAVRHGISKALTYLRAGPARRAQARRLPHPRLPRGRAQEVRHAPRPAARSSSPSADPTGAGQRFLRCNFKGRFGAPFVCAEPAALQQLRAKQGLSLSGRYGDLPARSIMRVMSQPRLQNGSTMRVEAQRRIPRGSHSPAPIRRRMNTRPS